MRNEQTNRSTSFTVPAQQYIDGRWQDGSSAEKLDDVNPYDESVLASFVLADKTDTDRAYAAAEKAQPALAAMLPSERAQLMYRAVAVMDKHEAEIKDLMTREGGSTLVKAATEFASARNALLDAASFPLRVAGHIVPSAKPGEESRVYRSPLGVVAVISPWNFPLNLSMRSVAPALALGNSVVLKPSGDTPITGGTLLARIFEEAGLLPGALNVVVGKGSTIGDYFAAHPTPAMISFTGSTAVGKHVGATACLSKRLKRLALELGGNAPIVVLDDADIDSAVRAAVFGRFLHQGQICMSTNRAIVDARLYDDFVDALVQHVQRLVCGNPALAGTDIGPIINRKQLDGIVQKIRHAEAQGAALLTGGAPDGNVLPPHVFANVGAEMSIALDETFGPVLPVLKADNEAHAVALANHSEFGLSGAVITADPERGVRFARQIVAGMVHVNDISVDDQVTAPFGGEKNSGLGRFNSDWIIEEMTRTQWITTRQTVPDYPF